MGVGGGLKQFLPRCNIEFRQGVWRVFPNEFYVLFATFLRSFSRILTLPSPRDQKKNIFVPSNNVIRVNKIPYFVTVVLIYI